MNEIEVYIESPILGGGVPSGGTTGQVLTKRSDQEGDYGWENPTQPEGVELTEHKVQEIGDGSSIDYPSTAAVKSYVDTGLSAKADTAVVEDLSRQVAGKVGDAPVDGVQYGRVNRSWRPIQYASGLTVSLAIPEGVNPALYTVVVRDYEDGTDERFAYYPGFAASIPAGKTVFVNVIPPTGCTAPVSAVYSTQAGVSYAFTGTSERISDGIYIFDKFGAYTPWQIWDTARNDDAVGVGYRSLAMSFVMAKKWASASAPTSGSNTYQSLMFGIDGVVAQDFGMVTAENKADALALSGYFSQNNAALLARHEVGQPGWRTDANITYNSGANYAPSAAACARFIACETDDIGSWGLPELQWLTVFGNTANSEFCQAYAKIKGSNDLAEGGRQVNSAIPNTRTSYYFEWQYEFGIVGQARTSTFASAKPFRPF